MMVVFRASLTCRLGGELGRRQYSVFKNLPKVGPQSTGNKPNRFAELYQKAATKSHKPQKPWHQKKSNNQGDPKVPPAPADPEARSKEQQAEEYSKIRRRLNERHKQQQAGKKENSGIKGERGDGGERGERREREERDGGWGGSGPQKGKARPVVKENIKISIPTFVTVSNLASIINVPLATLLAKLQELGFEGMSHQYILDKENASLIADEFGFDVTMSDDTGLDLFPAPQVEEQLRPRPPVVTIMGHVDHGKTTLLDYLRKSAVVKGEFGGITQHIGAFSVVTPISKKKITFLDTPGHAAFLSMRERGAIVTDIIILVVAADDSVMPQTIEAIKHAKKSGVPIIVAINKCDKPGIKIDKVLADLARHDVDIEDYGGDTQTVQVSGKTGLNMDKLEEAVITLSEMSDFQAESTVAAEGWVIESQVVKGLGNVSTVLVRRGTVKTGDFLVAGSTYCKVRGMKDEHGKMVKQAGPSTPVQVWGWKELPHAGDQLLQGPSEQVCKKVIQNRESREKQIQAFKDIESINEKRMQEVRELQRQEKINELKMAGLDTSSLQQEEEAGVTTVKYIVKSDVFGSAEAIKESVDGLGNEEVKATIISHDAGVPTESDLDMAEALNASILCFNLQVPKPIQNKADKLGVRIIEENVIYRLIEGVTADLTSKLKPHIDTKVLAEVELRNVFEITGKNKVIVKVAGCKVTSGVLKRASNVRVVRAGEVVHKGHLSTLKHVKQDIIQATKGFECGLSFTNWDKFKVGDTIEAYEETEVPRFL